MPRLEFLTGETAGTAIDLGEGEFRVGRAPDNQLALEDGTVSVHHARLQRDGPTVLVEDLGSTNGIWVNGRRVSGAVLRDGDHLAFGSVEFRFAAGPHSMEEEGEFHFTARFASRHQALAEAQVVPDPARCVQCGICSYNCPAGIDVRAHAWRGRPVFDSHCITCSECVQRCPRGVLRFERLPLFAQLG